jgi:hypothetical protein
VAVSALGWPSESGPGSLGIMITGSGSESGCQWPGPPASLSASLSEWQGRGLTGARLGRRRCQCPPGRARRRGPGSSPGPVLTKADPSHPHGPLSPGIIGLEIMMP